jgi:hypothetical protein
MSLNEQETMEKILLGNLIDEISLIDDLNDKKANSKFKKENSKINESSNLNTNNKTSITSSKNIFSKKEIFSYLSNQKSGMIFQSKVREMNSFEIEKLIEELKNSFSQCMMDRNGNYLCNDLFKICNSEERIIVLKEIKINFIELSLHQYATHPIQKLIEYAKTFEEMNIISSSFKDRNDLLKISLNPNGSFVLQKIITFIPQEIRNNINNLIIDDITILALDMYGVCILKKFIFFTNSNFNLQRIFKNICNNFLKISVDQYGNYLIQYVLEIYWNISQINIIKQNIENYFQILATDSFASHICETYIKLLNFYEKQNFCCFLMNNGVYNQLIKDKYGVFIINKLVNSIALNANSCVKNYKKINND